MLEGDSAPDMQVDSGDVVPPQETAELSPKPVPRRPSMFQDRMVRNLAFAAVGLTVVYLLIVIGALVSGVVGEGRPIQTAAERDLRLYEKMVLDGSRDEQVWGRYANALIRTKQYGKAQQVIDQANKARIVDPRAHHMVLAQVNLFAARKDWAKVIKTADSGLAALRKQSSADWAEYRKTGSPTSMTATGYGDNYYTLLYAKAKAHEALKQPKKAIEALDEYLKERNTAADVREWRGDLRAAAGNKKGALADYKKARVFMEDTAEIDAKIKGLGADK